MPAPVVAKPAAPAAATGPARPAVNKLAVPKKVRVVVTRRAPRPLQSRTGLVVLLPPQLSGEYLIVSVDQAVSGGDFTVVAYNPKKSTNRTLIVNRELVCVCVCVCIVAWRACQ